MRLTIAGGEREAREVPKPKGLLSMGACHEAPCSDTRKYISLLYHDALLLFPPHCLYITIDPEFTLLFIPLSLNRPFSSFILASALSALWALIVPHIPIHPRLTLFHPIETSQCCAYKLHYSATGN